MIRLLSAGRWMFRTHMLLLPLLCAGACGPVEPQESQSSRGTFDTTASLTLHVSDFLQTRYQRALAGGLVTLTEKNSARGIFAQTYAHCDPTLLPADKLAECMKRLATECPHGITGATRRGCIIENHDDGYKAGFYWGTERNPALRYFSKSGYPSNTMETFWFDADSIYVFSEPARTNGDGQIWSGEFHSFALPRFSGVTYPYRGALWYDNLATFAADGADGRYTARDILVPDNDVYNYFDNRLSWRTVWTGDEMDPVPTNQHLQAFLYPWASAQRLQAYNRSGGNLPLAEGARTDLLVIESSRRNIHDQSQIRFVERYTYARYRPTPWSAFQYLGLIMFERKVFRPHVCADRATFPDQIDPACEAGSLLTDARVYYNRIHSADMVDFWKQTFQHKPKNAPALVRGTYSAGEIWGAHTNHLRGAFQASAAGVDSNGASFNKGDWIFLRHNMADSDWLLVRHLWTDNMGCPPTYHYLWSFPTARALNHRREEIFYPSYSAICALTDDVRLVPAGCPPGYVSRARFVEVNDMAVWSFERQRVEDASGHDLHFCVNLREVP